MSHISVETLHHLARLSKLSIPSEKEEFYMQSLNRLLETVALLEKVDTSMVDNKEIQAVEALLREDVSVAVQHRAACESQAPQQLAHFYVVPQVIE